MIMFPTRNRPKSLLRFIENYKKTNATLPITVIIDQDNLEPYNEAWKEAPENWILFPNKEVRNLRDAMNSCVKCFPDDPFYGIIADDCIPITEGWDIQLSEACKPHYIAWPDDGIWGGNLPTHPFIGGDMVRAWGWFSPPYTNRHCADFIWKDFANALDIGKYCENVKIKHQHWQTGEAEFDATYATQPSPSEGHDQYHNVYKNSEQFKKDVESVKEKLGISQ